MFDSVRLEHKLGKEEFKEIEAQLRNELLDAQREMQERGTHSIMILINGADGAGKGEVLNRLYEWLDPRYLETIGIDIRDKTNNDWPKEWYYWRGVPAKGRVAAVLGSWYHLMLRERALGHLNREGFLGSVAVAREHETMLGHEGVRVLKLWLHLNPDEAERRYRKARGKSGFGHPLVQEWADVPAAHNKKRLHEAAKEVAQLVSPDAVPWVVVPAADARYRDVAVGRALLALMRATFAAAEPKAPAEATPGAEVLSPVATRPLPRPSIVGAIDLTKTVDPKDYKHRLREDQRRIFELTSSEAFRKRGLVCVFEGNDAAGKGGCIRRLRQALDPRDFRVHAVAAPSDEELARPYLWRFWRNIPRRGRTAVFDRSWYGRVLVERVEGFASVADWTRAYGEINAFERQLTRNGYIVLKFWLAISPEEQLRRFEERADTPYKQFKITDEDWRNREKWDLYEEAVTDMVDRTSTPFAPWTLVPAVDKRYARVTVLNTVADRLELALS
ncbi:polyphosphate:AMP phosphotransferase [Pseudochelatococcus lubricantis]|uniref:polyphosphate:AMP phosphotransferase n=1 Tax=Pseudochelatococcus lubricantis TaxID=1538102 RepID=UPI0035EC808A